MSFSEIKEKKLSTKCLPFKWNYIPLSLIELVSTYQISCPSPLLPQNHLIYKTLSWDKTNIKAWKQSKFFWRKSEKVVWKDSQKLYNLYLKTFLTDWIFQGLKKRICHFFFISLTLFRLSGRFEKNPKILKNIWKVCLKRYPKYPFFL